jgi:hypothetical protein
MPVSAPRPPATTNRELILAGGLAMSVGLLLATPPQLSADSYEVLATVDCWAGRAPCSGPSPWPPLWPALLVPFAGPSLPVAAWALNQLLAGAVAFPLYAATRRLAGTWAARAAVISWLMMPVVRQLAAVVDARPLMWLVAASCLALGLRAAQSERAWWPAFAVAALGPLVRPEGLAMAPLLFAAALLAGADWRRSLGLLAASLTPWLSWSALHCTDRTAYEPFGMLWQGVWHKEDLLALLGPPMAGTPFRELLLEASRVGVEAPGLDPLALLGFLPSGVSALGLALTGGVGLAICAGAALGARALTRRGWRAALALALCGSPLLALCAVPMPWSQSSPATNLIFLIPWILSLSWMGWDRVLARRRKRLLPLLLLPVALELYAAPWRLEPPIFLEDSIAAARMARWLEAHPPSDGRVACTYAGRSVVRNAGLVPVQLSTPWDVLDPQLPVLLTKDFIKDAGRGLQLLESPDRRPLAWTGPAWKAWGEEGGWYVYLSPSSP